MSPRAKADIDLVYRHTHRDYRSDPGVVPRTVLVLRLGGTTQTTVEGLTDEEFEGKLRYARGAEARRKARIAEKRAAKVA